MFTLRPAHVLECVHNCQASYVSNGRQVSFKCLLSAVMYASSARNVLHNVSPIKVLLRLYFRAAVCARSCQSAVIKRSECVRRGRYSSSLTGFSHRFPDSSVITALL